MRLAGGSGNGRAAAVFAVSGVLLFGILVVVLSRPAFAHTADVILGLPSSEDVILDGRVTTAEWSEAAAVTLRANSASGPETTLFVKYNDSFLFVALDLLGDRSEDPQDFVWIAFDTEHDGLTSLGREDIFFHSEFFDGGQAHYTFDGRAWSIQDSPYDPARPNHFALDSEWGFGPSTGSARDHRQAEFRVPLPLLGATPGDVLGFLATVVDARTGGQSSWPLPLPRGQLNDYGDLLLTKPAGPADLLLLPPSEVQTARAGDSISYALSVTNQGTGGPDTFDFSAVSDWPLTFWDSTGTTMLGDSDADARPDTGLIASGASFALLVLIEVPSNATGPNEATVTATSSTDAQVSAIAELITELPPVLFNPLHSDLGEDTDAPPDGVLDALVVQTNISVVEGGTYSIDGILNHDNLTAAISSARRVVTFGVGNYIVDLSFFGEDIYRARTNGPYRVHLILSDATDTLDQSDHTTKPYAFTAFQKPLAVFAPPHADSGLDTDGDGLFDQLVVEIQFEVREEGIFLLTADLHGSLIDGTSNATQLGPGLHTVSMWLDGRRVNASEVDGPYEVSIVLYDFVTTEFLDRIEYTTASYSHLEFQTPLAAFASPHADAGVDTDGDGRFDYLVTEANLSVSQAGTYRVEGTLFGSRIGFTSNITTLGTGSHTVPLWFDGVAVNVSQVDGPYTVELTLYSALDLLDAESHVTAAYGHLEFEEPRAQFSASHFDSGRDDDGDGQFDFLVVNVTLVADTQGRYTVEGTLRDTDSLLVLSASNQTTLDVGAQSRHLLFPGPRINASDVDGPYTVELVLIERTTSLVLATDAHSTAPYSHEDFDAPSGRFTGPPADDGRDLDGDGLADLLVVEAGIAIQQAGAFLIEAYFSDPTFQLSLFAFNVTSLEAGSQSVELAFEGVAINVSGMDGPYLVELYLYDWVTFEFLDNETHSTASYGHREFDGQAASLGSPHADRGGDTDGDGPFNDLVVDVEVDVAEAGTFSVSAFIYDPSFTLFFSATNVSSLDVGPQTVAIVFDGTRINATGVDGPYTVEISLTDVNTLRLLDSDVHTTAAYAAAEFEGPEPLFATPSSAPPTIDGVMAQGEWNDAFLVDLEDIAGNAVPGFLLVKNDWRFVYVAYDATGDITGDPFDVASIAFDTGHDGVPTSGREDQFVQGGRGGNDQAHFVYDATFGTWILQDAPYNARLPVHQGLASAVGFGASSREATPHRVYEFAIPLALLGAAPGEDLGFFGGSQFAPGLYDDSSGEWSLWPAWNNGPLGLSKYGDLVLGMLDDLMPPTLVILDPAPNAISGTSDVRVTWFASDLQSGLDHLEVSLNDGDPTVLPPTVFDHTFSGLAEGPHTVRLRAVDVTGNMQIEILNFTVDTVPPTILIISPLPDSFLNRSSIELTWMAVDATTGVSAFGLVLDGVGLANLPETTPRAFVEELEDGRHVFEVQAIDRAGHVSTDSVAFTVDTVPPDLVVSLPEPDAVITTSRIEVAWEASDATSGVLRVEVRLDDGKAFVFPATSGSYVLVTVPDGIHSVTVSAFDRAENEETIAVFLRVDTNMLSPKGPLGVGPLIAVLATAGVAALGLFLFLRKRGRPPA